MKCEVFTPWLHSLYKLCAPETSQTPCLTTLLRLTLLQSAALAAPRTPSTITTQGHCPCCDLCLTYSSISKSSRFKCAWEEGLSWPLTLNTPCHFSVIPTLLCFSSDHIPQPHDRSNLYYLLNYLTLILFLNISFYLKYYLILFIY